MIELHCISIIVPIHKLNAVYRGGFQQYKKDFSDRIRRAIVLNGLDNDLLCISVNNPVDINSIVTELESYGLQEMEEVCGEKVCKDFCVHDILNGCKYRCKWLVIYASSLAAYLHKENSYFEVVSDLCQTFRHGQAQARKRAYNVRMAEINAALKSSMEINDELNERNLCFTDDVTGQEYEVVKSTFVGRDREDALWKKMVPVYEKLAKGGDGEAYNLLGIIFQLKKELAIEYFKLGMAHGSVNAAFNLAMLTDDKEKKFALYLWASEHIVGIDEQDDRMRCVLCENLAMMYHLGMGTLPNCEEAERWYREAIANHAVSKSVEDNLIAMLFENGKRLEAIRLIYRSKNAVRKMKGRDILDKANANWDRICYWGVPEQAIQLSIITDSYIDCVTYFEEHKNADNWNKLLWGLPDLTLHEDYVLDDFRPRDQMNSVLWLYARPKDLPRPSDEDFYFAYKKRIKPLEPFHYITLPFTEEAIWQAFLLSQTYRLTGMRWHGGYAARTFVLLDKDIVKVTDKVQEEARRIWSPDLNVSVVLGDGGAVISHCWFDRWKGLVQMKWEVKYDALKRQVTGIDVKDEKVLVKYECGIRY